MFSDSISSLASELRDLHAAHELELQVLLRRHQREREAVLRRFSSLSATPPAPAVIRTNPPSPAPAVIRATPPTTSTPQQSMGTGDLNALTRDIMAFLYGSKYLILVSLICFYHHLLYYFILLFVVSHLSFHFL